MARIYPLFSSSRGNSYFIGNEKSGILIDCGVSFRRLSNALSINNIPLSAVHGVFITHEHTDHIQGLKVLTKNLNIPVYSTRKTLGFLYDKDKVFHGASLIDMTEKKIVCADMEITCFSTPHDAVQSCGYKVHTSDGKYCAVCTDLGHVTEEVQNELKGCRLAVIEANYDENMLRTGNYPFELRQRILSPEGHLSNDECGKLADSLVKCGTCFVILGHLSPENNRPDIAEKTVQSYMKDLQRGKDYLMGTAPCETNGGAVIF